MGNDGTDLTPGAASTPAGLAEPGEAAETPAVQAPPDPTATPATSTPAEGTPTPGAEGPSVEGQPPTLETLLASASEADILANPRVQGLLDSETARRSEPAVAGMVDQRVNQRLEAIQVQADQRLLDHAISAGDVEGAKSVNTRIQGRATAKVELETQLGARDQVVGQFFMDTLKSVVSPEQAAAIDAIATETNDWRQTLERGLKLVATASQGQATAAVTAAVALNNGAVARNGQPDASAGAGTGLSTSAFLQKAIAGEMTDDEHAKWAETEGYEQEFERLNAYVAEQQGGRIKVT